MENEQVLCYDVKDLCGLLKISRPTAYELVHRADFPKVRVGRRVLIPRVGLEKWLEDQSNIRDGGSVA